MATKTTIKELRNMQKADLLKEINAQQFLVAKLRLNVKLQKEKNTSKYSVAKKQLAQMKTILGEKQREELQSSKQDTTVSTPKAEASASTKTTSSKK